MNLLNKINLRSYSRINIFKNTCRYSNHHYASSIHLSPTINTKWKSFSTQPQSPNTQLQNRYEYNLNELAPIINKSKTIEIPTINESNAVENLVKFLKQNEIHTKNDLLYFNNLIIYVLKLNGNVDEIFKSTIEAQSLDEFSSNFEQHIDQLTIDEMVAAMIAWTSIDVPLYHPAFRSLIIQTTRNMKELEDIPLKTLTNFAIFARQHSDKMYPYFLCADGTSHIMKHLNQCQNIDDLYQISIYLEKLRKFLTKDMMALHKMKMKDIMTNLDPKYNTKQLIRIMYFYVHLLSAFKNSRIIKNLLLLIADEIPNLSNTDLQSLNYIQDVINEPISIVPRILEVAESRPDKSTDINLLYCRSSTHLPDEVQKISAELLNYINGLDSKNITKNTVLSALFKYKRHLHMNEINQIYWKKVTDDITIRIASMSNRESDAILSSYSNRFCLSNKRMIHGTDCAEFQTKFSELFKMNMVYGTASLTPHQLSRLAMFILSYASSGSHNFSMITDDFVEKIDRMAPQFSINEIIDIASGLDQCYINGMQRSAIRRRAFRVLRHLDRLANIVSESIERVLDERTSIQIDSLCLLIRAHTTNRVLKRDRTLEKLFKRLKEHCSTNQIIMTPYTIHNVTRSLYRTSYAIPKLCENMLNYVNENRDTVNAETVSRLLYYLFKVGYEPDREMDKMLPNHFNNDKNIDAEKLLNSDLFHFESFVKVINRDFDLTPAWLIVQACLALSFYQALPIDLINRVFNVDFITRLEKEMSLNCDKFFYPKNVLTSIMRLNRAVCLEYPEASIPWFQQNFIEAHLTTFKPRPSAYFKDIHNMLLKLVGGDKSMIRLNHVTPYGYRIPFVIYFNSHKQLVSPPLDEGPQLLNKVAILPLLEKDYCSNQERRIGGGMLHLERHLSILGYDVIQICHREWNSMHMSLPGARENLLRNFLKKYRLLIE